MVLRLCRRPLVLIFASLLTTAVIVVVAVAAVIWFTTDTDKSAFPAGFLIGAASSAYQIEGAWNLSGKGESIWDNFTHKDPTRISDLTNGDVACDSYHRYLEDVQMVKEMGFDMYRFSLSWTRILPLGYGAVNQAGLDHYHSLIDELIINNIEPVVTIYHWDLPQPLEDLGGWTNPIMADYFLNFSAVCFEEFGNKVKWWVTINEMNLIRLGYSGTTLAPGRNDSGVSDYSASHNLLRAHAKVYRYYESVYKSSQQGEKFENDDYRLSRFIDKKKHVITQFAIDLIAAVPTEPKKERVVWCAGGGVPTGHGHPKVYINLVKPGDHSCKIGVANHVYNIIPENASSADDVDAADRANQWQLGIFAHPIFSEDGDYPAIVRQRVDNNSLLEGRNTSRLPYFTSQEIIDLKGSADFFGINHYYTKTATSGLTGRSPSFERDSGAITSTNSISPGGFRAILNWVRNQYDNPTVLVTENGFYDENGVLNDTGRVQFFHDFIDAMLGAIYDDGCDIIGYTAWSLMDNFEWYSGYSVNYGLWHVDFNNSSRPRSIKQSGVYVKRLVEERRLVSLD